MSITRVDIKHDSQHDSYCQQLLQQYSTVISSTELVVTATLFRSCSLFTFAAIVGHCNGFWSLFVRLAIQLNTPSTVLHRLRIVYSFYRLALLRYCTKRRIPVC